MISRPTYQDSDCWKFSIWNVGNSAGQGGEEKANLRKAVIGQNLAFGIEYWGAYQSAPSLGNLAGNVSGNSVGNLLGNTAGSLVGNSAENLV